MPTVELTFSHWIFLLVVLSIFIAIGLRKGVIIPSILGIFFLGAASDLGGEGVLNKSIFAVQVVFRALLNAGVELFDIMLVIALMVAMLKSLQVQGADRIMVAPMKKLMVGPWSAFFILAITMYLAAAFFWPTPSVALVGTVLIPVAVRVGLSAIGAAVAVNIAGHGMALSADPVIQGATRLTSSAANVDPNEILPYTILFSVVVGVVAISISCFLMRKEMAAGQAGSDNGLTFNGSAAAAEEEEEEADERDWPFAKFFAIAVPVILLSIALLMIYRALFNPEQSIKGGDATALLGGTAIALLVISTIAARGHHAMEAIVSHIRDGFFFAIRIFAPIIPIAGFFLLGNPDHAVAVIGEGTPGYLFDVGNFIGEHLNGSAVLLGFGVSAIAVLAGLDGSGFSGLPLVGSLAGALATGAGVDVVVLAALGQVVTIFVGGGTLVAWAFGACADAGIAGVTPTELVRRNFFPVLAGLIVVTMMATVMMV